MLLQHSDAPQSSSDLRLDRDTAEKVTALALRLQERRGTTLSVEDIEEAGKEVGLQPEFVREAVAQVRRPERRLVDRTSALMRWGKIIHPAWWASGWALPIALAAGADALGIPSSFGGAAFMGAMGIYVGFGVILSMLFGDHPSKVLSREEQEALLRSIGRWSGPVSAPSTLLPQFGSTPVLARSPGVGEETHLYVSPRCSVGGKPGRDFAVWALSVIWEEGGELLSADSDGIQTRFSTATAALRAAHRLQVELPESAAMGVESVSCGVAPDAPANRRLAESAAAGDILIAETLAAEGLRELGRLARIEHGPAGALSWKAARDG